MKHHQTERCKFLGIATSTAESLRHEAEIRLLKALIAFPGLPAYRRDGVLPTGGRYVTYREVPGKALSHLHGSSPATDQFSSFPLLDWLSLVRQLLILADCLHRGHHPVFHGDISASNVIVSPDGKVGLIDFGVARSRLLPYNLRFSSRRSTAAPLYLSPEQANGRYWGSASDIYQIGLVTLEFLLNQTLGQDLEVSELLARLRHDPAYAQRTALRETSAPYRFLAFLLDPIPARRPSARSALGLLNSYSSA